MHMCCEVSPSLPPPLAFIIVCAFTYLLQLKYELFLMNVNSHKCSWDCLLLPM